MVSKAVYIRRREKHRKVLVLSHEFHNNGLQSILSYDYWQSLDQVIFILTILSQLPSLIKYNMIQSLPQHVNSELTSAESMPGDYIRSIRELLSNESSLHQSATKEPPTRSTAPESSHVSSIKTQPLPNINIAHPLIPQ